MKTSKITSESVPAPRTGKDKNWFDLVERKYLISSHLKE